MEIVAKEAGNTAATEILDFNLGGEKIKLTIVTATDDGDMVVSEDGTEVTLTVKVDTTADDMGTKIKDALLAATKKNANIAEGDYKIENTNKKITITSKTTGSGEFLDVKGFESDGTTASTKAITANADGFGEDVIYEASKTEIDFTKFTSEAMLAELPGQGMTING